MAHTYPSTQTTSHVKVQPSRQERRTVNGEDDACCISDGLNHVSGRFDTRQGAMVRSFKQRKRRCVGSSEKSTNPTAKGAFQLWAMMKG